MPIRTFEDCILEIDNEIRKRKSKWNLTALSWMDYDDVSQIIRIHINNKWHLYNQNEPLAPWVNTVISNQIRNLFRNLHGNHARPCLRCAASEGDDLCSIYTKQCSDCPLFATWEKSKKRAHDVKLPVSLENHAQEVFDMAEDSFDIERSSKNLHARMEKVLKPMEWRVYKYLYIDNLTDEEVANIMGYTTSEKNRAPGYKQIKNIKKIILTKVRKCMSNGEVDVYS
jgi:DNA-directed RNA polymerase specialized sigma24 family protein